MARTSREVYVVDAARLPVGRARKGTLVKVRPDELGALNVRELVKKADIDPAIIEDLLIGCAGTEGEQGMNVARTICLLADLPVTIAAATINRYCASSLCSIDIAASQIAFGAYDVAIAGGIESMSMIPTLQGGLTPDRVLNIRLLEKAKDSPKAFTMIQTAQYLHERYGVSKEDVDRFSYESHMKAIKAIDEGKFREYMIPIPLRQKTDTEGNIYYLYEPIENLDKDTYDKMYHITRNGLPGVDPQKLAHIKDDLYCMYTDEGPRRDTSIDKIAVLPPVVPGPIVKKDFPLLVTAGNSSQINDGAAAVLLMSEDKMKQLGKKPLARLVSFAVAGVEPYQMGIGPSRAIPKALKKANLKIDDIDLVEINEAFAVVVLTNLKLLKEEYGIEVPYEKVNVNGGGVSIGHPLGASGARIVCDVLYELKRRKGRYAITSLCVGGGMGEAAIWERVE